MISDELHRRTTDEDRRPTLWQQRAGGTISNILIILFFLVFTSRLACALDCSIDRDKRMVVPMGLFSPLGWILRPALFPIIGATGGLFYGAYDLTYILLRPLVGNSDRECSSTRKLFSFLGGLGVSGSSIYARMKISPPPPIPELDLSSLKHSNFVVRYVKQTTFTIRHFPILWYASSTALAGAVTGATVAFVR